MPTNNAKGLEEVLGLLGKATPGEWPTPAPSRFGTDHFTVDHHPLPHIAAIKRREDADAVVAAVNYLRSHGEAIAELIEAAGAHPVMDGRGFHIQGTSGRRYTETGSHRYEPQAEDECKRILAAALRQVEGQ